jgi:hypothetical protein
MFETIWLDTLLFFGALHVVTPAVVRYAMRFSARCNPVEVSLDGLPEEVAALIRPHLAKLASLGFERLGCYDCGSLTSETRSYMAYFCNRATSEFASVSALVTPGKTASYLEFSTMFTNGLVLETNTNSTLPLTPANDLQHIFRFPKIHSPQALYVIHRHLVEKYAPGLWPQAEPKGEELHRFTRVIENYGPRHARIGYMQLAEDGQSYKLTWKGAFLMTWCGLWPTSIFRKILQHHATQSELDSLHVSGVTALQKA